jgi:hypothetical protein
MEVLHGDIRLTLSDADAIRGMERTRRAVKQGMKQIARERAELSITGNLKDLKRTLKESKALIEKNEADIEKLLAKRETQSGSAKGATTRRLKALQRETAELKSQEQVYEGLIGKVSRSLERQRRTNKEAALGTKQAALRVKEEEALEDAIRKNADAQHRAYVQAQKDLQNYGRMQSKAHDEDMRRTRELALMRDRAHDQMEADFRSDGLMRRRAHAMMEADMRSEGLMRLRARKEMDADFAKRGAQEMAMRRRQQEALDIEIRRPREIAKAQAAYNKLNQELQKMQQQTVGRKVARAVSPRVDMEADIKEKEVLGEMAILRAKLEAMGAEPIDIRVNLRQGDILAKLASIGDIGMRIGPFTGTLGQFSKAALILGPILTGLVGSTTALAGAIGTGLTGALGIGATGLFGFGAALGVAFGGVREHFQDLQGVIKRSQDYNKKVEQYGKNSDEAGKALKKFKHILGDVDKTTLDAFNTLDKLGPRWSKMTSEIRPDFFDTVAVGITSLDRSLPMLARHSTEINGTIMENMRSWARGLSGGKGQSVISQILGRTEDSIDPFMDALGNLGAAFGKVTASFARHFKPLMEDFKDWTGGLNDAADNTKKLDGSVDRLVGSFRSTLNLLRSIGGLLKEVSSIAMGPGGSMMDDMAGGLDRITRSLRDNPTGLRDFFEDSIETTKLLYGVLKPVMGLFMEFSTILRPLTNIALQFAGAVAGIAKSFAEFGPVKGILTAYLSLWFLKRANLAVIGLFSGAINGLAAALGNVGRAGAAAKLGAMSTALTRGPGTVGAAGTARTVATTAPTALGAAHLARTGGNPAANLAKTGGMMSTFGRRLTILSTGLLGVSAPVAALGAAAVGAVIGIKKLKDASDDRAAQTARAKSMFGANALPTPPKPVMPNFGTTAGLPTLADEQAGQAHLKRMEQWRAEKAQIEEAARVGAAVDVAVRQRVAIQRELADAYSQRVNAQLNTDMAEKSYAAAVKESGKNSLEARVALQGLRDARRDEKAALEAYVGQQKQAAHWANVAVDAAERTYNMVKGTAAEPAALAMFEKAKDDAAAFDLAVGRAKKGLDAFTGEGASKLGHFVRQFAGIKGFKKLIISADTQEAALKIGRIVDKLDAAGKAPTVAKIIADSKSPEEALKRLRAALDRVKDPQKNIVKLSANIDDAKSTLGIINTALSAYGKRKPEALLKARDEAKKKIDALEAQLRALDGKKADVDVNVKFTLPSTFKSDAAGGDYPGRGDNGDGRGTSSPHAPNLKRSVKSFAEGNSSKLSGMFLQAGGLGGMEPGGKSGLNAFNSLATSFGLTVGSGFRKGSITSSGRPSYHGMGRARDFPGSASNMMQFAQFMAATFGARLKELIYTPMGFAIKDGRRVAPYAQKDHYDHVHVAMAQGGRIGANPSDVRSGRYTQPQVLFAEETRRPEYFISTNPRDRKRSRRLVAEAASEIGMMDSPLAFARGGKRGNLQSQIMSRVLKAAPGLGEWNKIFKTTFMGKTNGKTPKMTQLQVRAIAEAVGFDPTTALHMSQIARGESGMYPGMQQRDPGDGMVGHGLLQMTPNAWGAKAKNYMAKLGGINAMKNPVLNMAMAKFLSDDAVKSGKDALAPWYGKKYLNRNSKAKGSVLSQFGAAKGASETSGPGATTNLANRVADAQGRYDVAKSTSPLGDDLAALVGTPSFRRKMTALERSRHLSKHRAAINDIDERLSKKKLPRREVVALRKQRSEHRKALSQTTTTQTGTLGLIKANDMEKGSAIRRIRKIDEALKGTLRPSKRQELLDERAGLITSLAANRVKGRDLRKERDEGVFEQGQIAQGVGRDQTAYAKAQAEGTATLKDDIEVAKMERNYWQDREGWALSRGDLVGAAEARTNWQNAAKQAQELQHQAEEAIISYGNANAAATLTLSDDLAMANGELAYWTSRRNAALAQNDIPGAAAAQSNINTAVGRVKDIEQDMATLPLLRNLSLANLTEDLADDAVANSALRDYWKGRLDFYKSIGDNRGIIEAAGQFKNYDDAVKSGEQSIQAQSIAVGDARLQLFRQFGSNFIQSIPSGTRHPQPTASAPVGQTTVNVTNHFTAPPPDALTFASNVAWELQAAV